MKSFLDTKYNIMNIGVDVLSREKFLELIKNNIENSKKTVVYTPYSEFIYKAQVDKSFQEVLNSATINIADGVFIQIASIYYESVKKSKSQFVNFMKLIAVIFQMIAKKVDRTVVFPELLSGSHEIHKICKLAEENKYSVYLLGGAQNVVYIAGQNLQKEFPNLNIVGKQEPRAFSPDDKAIINDINDKKPDILLVCLGAQKQEKWVYKYKDKLNTKVMVCLGGTFDYVSGKRKLQSKWWSDRGLNWLHRLLSEPIRIKRQAVILKLLWLLAGEKINK
jgi:N-acetylglucosaminyldiphosphoundecaprenol N-acetyl-beta-D-mannosaminyltransferase